MSGLSLLVISVSYNECKRDWPPLHSPQRIEVRKSRHPFTTALLFGNLSEEISISSLLSNFRLISHANL